MRIVENKLTITTDSVHKEYDDDDVYSPEKKLIEKSLNLNKDGE